MKRVSLRTFLFAALAVPLKRPSIEIVDFRMIESKTESALTKRSLEINATSAQLYKPEEITTLQAPRAKFWGAQKRPFEIQGELGILNGDTQDLTIRGSAEVLSPDLYLFRTKDLDYDSHDRVFRGEDPVEGFRKVAQAERNLRITGTGLRIYLNENIYEIPRNVIAQQMLSPGNPFTIRSRRSEIAPEKSIATFQSGVSVRAQKMDLRGEKLIVNLKEGRPSRLAMTAENTGKIQATLSDLKIRSKGLQVALADNGDIDHSEALGDVESTSSDGTQLKAQKLTSGLHEGKQRLILEGDVTILTDNRVASCEYATYFPESGDIVLERVASVKGNGQSIEGERIRFSTKNAEIKVEGAKGEVVRKQLGI